MQVRRAEESDLIHIRNLAFKIWPDTYKDILSEAQIDYMLNSMYAIEVLTQQMEEGQDFYILEEHSDPIGFAAFSSIDAESFLFKLHKIYILPSFQGKGAGRLLLNKVVDSVKEKGAKFLKLNVNRNNKAQFFYEKLGFKIISEEDIAIGNNYFMNDYVMQLAF